MSMVRKTITLPPPMDKWVKSQIDAGRYANDSEYVRDLIRRDQDAAKRSREAKTELRKLIQEGLDSGISPRSSREIFADVKARMRGDGRLPVRKAGRSRSS
jgi:antitoxin ParD1/3/4